LAINPRSGEAYEGIGWALTDSFDQHLEAEANFRKAIEIWPRYADAHYGLGVTQYRREQYEAALASLQTARSHAPKSAYITMWVGAALRELERFPEARAMLEKALTLKPGDETIQAELDDLADRGG
jgi:tetratricopeptide (TPR) repeat protein